MDRSTKNIVIVGNGEDWQKEKMIHFCQHADFIIAADNGLALLHHFDIKPDLIIGDLDSVSPSILEQYPETPVEKYPSKKDFTDSELSLQKAISMDPREIILLAMTGNYFDHSYGAVINLFRNSRPDIEMKIITSNATIFPVTESMTLPGLKGRRFSLFPLTTVEQFSLEGSEYQLSKKDLSIMDYSIGNVVTHNPLKINFKKGILFCVLFDPGFQ